MPNLKKLNFIHVLIVLSFLIWLYCFRGFIFAKIGFTSDALAYYEHFKFYFDQISRGIYPMWDPTREETGAPIDFFLRRIGPYNPFIFVILILYKIGLSFLTAYVIFLSLYYFLGMIGFYLLSKTVLGDTLAAFGAFLLLMFSSLGTRLFDSYILFTCIPMVWFFYFLVMFIRRPHKFTFLGITFTLMILFTTYIPFYFVTIFATFLGVGLLVYIRDVSGMIRTSGDFLRKSKAFAVLCLLIFSISLVPGILFFKDAGKGEFALPNRSYNSHASHAMAVDIGTITQWGIEEDLRFSADYANLHHFKFAILYVPVFALPVFLLGMWGPLNRRLIFLFILGMSIFVMFAHHAGIYHFLFDHIFYFKYFRNLHFFLWMILLPLFILFLGEQFRSLLHRAPLASQKYRMAAVILVVLLHIGLIALQVRQGDAIFSTYLALGLSLVFFTALVPGRPARPGFLALLLWAAVVIQPLEVYHYLPKNVILLKGPYRYEEPYLFFQFPDTRMINKLDWIPYQKLETFVEEKDPVVYMGVKSMNYLWQNLHRKVLNFYLNARVKVYDRVEHMADQDIDIERIGKAFINNENVAFVSSRDAVPPQWPVDHPDANAEIIMKGASNVTILEFDTNFVKFKTQFNAPKFFVYNDVFHSQWEAFINGQKTPIYRANVAFKGVWLPAGENILHFRFGQRWQYALNYALIFIFFLTFAALLRYAISYKKVAAHE